MVQEFDAAVLGAGVAGASLAKTLADKGWNTVLIDRKTFPRHKVCGEFMSPESIGLLHGLQLEDTVSALNPARITKARLIFPNGRIIEVPLPGTALGLSRYALDTTLHKAAVCSGASLLDGHVVQAISQPSAGEGFAIQLRHSGEIQTIEARTVVSAMGGSVPAGLPGHRRLPDKGEGYIGVKAHYDNMAIGSAVELYILKDGYLGLSPVEDGKINAAALVTSRLAKESGSSAILIMEQFIDMHPPLRKRMSQAELIPGTAAAVFPVHIGSRPQIWDRIPLAGDTAAVIPPLCGDGMAMALRSSQLCAGMADQFLRGELSYENWRQAYTHAIRSEFLRPLNWGNMLHRLLKMPAAAWVLPQLANTVPGLSSRLVRATRL
ncbi:NAD(P)/FAD-dependent oxidoreductase [Paenibacillus sambharensis]|uniref:NAD(P)/FAD-dependent oxidoreductase n=1 Tax=Paenibacillus sambharensis TaxID=1803190 RepID=A0A2W1LMM9_9BACL|nr:NAD(P)/FAD-dependent oxidoreductase [Paenibacillus sambharensis]PZD96242.1 NAD(P)/FAD-dependent oxidoreductase [Paenibacillus sambharensis]